METYLSIIQNSLGGGSNAHIAAGIVIIGILLCLLAVMGSRRKAVGRVAALEKAQAVREQEKLQLSQDLQASQEKLQHVESELTAKNQRIEQLEQEKQAALAQAERTTILEGQLNQSRRYLSEALATLEKDFAIGANEQADSENVQEEVLWQRHSAALAQLTTRLQNSERSRLSLEQAQQAVQTQLAEKESALAELRPAFAAQAGQIAKLEQDFIEQQALMQQQQNNAEAELAKVQEKNRSYKAHIDKLELGRMQVFNDLNLSAQKAQQLESALKDKAAYLEPEQPEPVVQKIEVQGPQLEEKPAEQQINLEPIEEVKPSKPLFARFINTLGMGKQQPATDDSAEVKVEAQEHPHEEISAEQPINIEPTKEDKPANPLFVRFKNTLGLGKQQPETGDSIKVEIQEEPREEISEPPIPPEEVKSANPLFARFRNTLGLGKQPAKKDATEEQRDEIEKQTEEQPASLDEATENTKYIAGQLKNFYQKMTSSTKN